MFALLEPSQLQECFVSWVKSIAELSVGEIVSIDGKSARHSDDKGKGRGAIHLTSLYGGIERFAEASRGHWVIENKLHWSVDVYSMEMTHAFAKTIHLKA